MRGKDMDHRDKCLQYAIGTGSCLLSMKMLRKDSSL
jgi:hypothetical protein